LLLAYKKNVINESDDTYVNLPKPRDSEDLFGLRVKLL